MKTPAFRSLVKADPTDRIAALIMVHGRPESDGAEIVLNSSTVVVDDVDAMPS